MGGGATLEAWRARKTVLRLLRFFGIVGGLGFSVAFRMAGPMCCFPDRHGPRAAAVHSVG
jgi:hypothetical protein